MDSSKTFFFFLCSLSSKLHREEEARDKGALMIKKRGAVARPSRIKKNLEGLHERLCSALLMALAAAEGDVVAVRGAGPAYDTGPVSIDIGSGNERRCVGDKRMTLRVPASHIIKRRGVGHVAGEAHNPVFVMKRAARDGACHVEIGVRLHQRIQEVIAC